MNAIIIDSLIDSAKTIPLLLLVYAGIEILEYKYSAKILEKVRQAGKAGPVFGALAGILPQCGFSVFTTALYNQRLVTIGTLMAVYLSTSDEAIPVILSQPDKAGIILPLIFSKLAIALVFGYALDFYYHKKSQLVLRHSAAYNQGHDDPGHHHSDVLTETACCGHHVESHKNNFNWQKYLVHPLIHAAKIFVYLFLATLLINIIFANFSDAAISKIFLGSNFFQPIVAAMFGLIPNCAASVGITQLYLKGIITFGSAIAGLSASGGLGILILFREEKRKREAIKIVFILYSLSVLAGLFFQYILRF